MISKKKLIIVAFSITPIVIISALILIPILLLQIVVQSGGSQNLGDGACLNYEVGSNIPVNGLTSEQAANAVILVQDAMNRGLGKDGAAIAVTAALTESGLRTDPGGDNYYEPESMWSTGIFQTKLYYQFKDAWKKPNGGYYPQSDPNSIAKAKAMALDPKQQSKWFYDRLSGEAPSTKSLANFKWRTAPQYRGKPWVVAQKIEQSRFTNGSNYKKTWEGGKGVIPMEVVEAILNSDVSETTSTGDDATFTTLTTAFPDLPVAEDGTYLIPGPNSALSPSGYPTLGNGGRWVTEISLPTGASTDVAKWSKSAFEDLFTRWEASPVLSDKYSLSKIGAKVRGFQSFSGRGTATDFNSGTAIRLLPDSLRANTLTPEQAGAIQRIIRDMGGILSWGGANDPGYFYITPELRPENLDSWATTATRLGQPPYFFVGDSIGSSMSGLITQNLPQSTTDTRNGRKTSEGIRIIKDSRQAKVAKTWIIQLGTNDGNNPTAFKGYIDEVMKLAGSRQVFWINAYRPADNPMGDATENNTVLRQAQSQYPNLTVVDWHNRAISNPTWFETDTMKLHPNTDGKEALMDVVLASVTGNGNGSVTGVSYLCGGGTGQVSDEYYVSDSVLPTGKFTTNTGITIKNAVAIRNRAMSFVGNPPSSCVNANCRSNCLHLAARAWGRGSSGWYDARKAMGVIQDANQFVYAANPATGEKNPEAFNIPIGALVFWNPDPNGHIATYVGDGMVVSNGNWENKGDGVYLVPMEIMNNYGRGYEGYTANPVWAY